MADAEFYRGQGVFLVGTYKLRNDDGSFTLYDPITAIVSWKTPDRVLHTYTADRLSLGSYQKWVYLDQLGVWVAGFHTGTGDPGAAATELTFVVKSRL